MPNRRRSARVVVSRFTENEVNDLIFKLQAFLPADHSTCGGTRESAASKILEETCNFIMNLQKEVEDLSERLSQLLASGGIDGPNADIIRRLLKL